MKNPTRHTQENPLTDFGIYFCIDRIILVNGPVGIKMIRIEMCIVSYRIVISDTVRHDTIRPANDTIRYGATRYSYALEREEARYDTIRPQATTIRPANDTIRYDQRRGALRYELSAGLRNGKWAG